MLFKATVSQVKRVAKEACKASGVEIAIDKIPFNRAGDKAGIFIDSLGGKQINLELRKQAENVWYYPDKAPTEKKQQWSRVYPSYERLLAYVKGIEIYGPKPAVVVAKEKEKAAKKEEKTKEAVKEELAPIAALKTEFIPEPEDFETTKKGKKKKR